MDMEDKERQGRSCNARHLCSFLHLQRWGVKMILIKKKINCFKCQLVLTYIFLNHRFNSFIIEIWSSFFFFLLESIHLFFFSTKLSCARIWLFSPGSNISSCHKQHMDIDNAIILCATFQQLLFSVYMWIASDHYIDFPPPSK